MNVCQWVGVENKKNNSLSRPSYLMNRQCLSRKIPIKKENKKKKRKKKRKKEGEKAKLNAPHVIYNVNILYQ